ncbi:MAG: TraR/DksA C4-type zinc finger protein [Elusimicrobiota bacterium]
MKQKEVEKIREDLEEEQKELLEEVEKIKEREDQYIDTVGDEIDKATEDTQRERLFYMSEHDRQKLDMIEDALQKISHGRYGICEICGKKINDERLKAIPYVRDCVDCHK